MAALVQFWWQIEGKWHGRHLLRLLGEELGESLESDCVPVKICEEGVVRVTGRVLDIDLVVERLHKDTGHE
jgi:hypothetical protein